MKKWLSFLTVGLVAIVLAACSSGSGDSSESGSESATEEPLDIVLFVSGLGDMSFSDSANEGIISAEEKYGDQINAEVVEYGYDSSVIESYLLDAADMYDIVIGPSQFVDAVSQHAPDYPDTKFWIYGSTFPFEDGEYPNVYSMLYRSNEASFLAGVAGALESDSGQIGFLGGVDNNVINDFWLGYAQGAQYANPEISIVTNYVGSFDDTARGKELSLAMYGSGSSTIFNVAGPVGLGLAEAAVEVGDGASMIGVDADQAAAFRADGRDAEADTVATSVLTNVGETIDRAIGLELEGQLTYGEVDSLGLVDGAVDIVIDENYEATTSEETRTAVEEAREGIVNGDITVDSVYDLPDGIDALREELAP